MLVLGMLAFVRTANSGNLYQTNKDDVVNCKDERALSMAKYSANAVSALPVGCTRLQKGTSLDLNEQVNLVIHVPALEKPDGTLEGFPALWGFHVNRKGVDFAASSFLVAVEDVDPVLDASGKVTRLDQIGHPIAAGCDAPSGGVVKRLETDSDGRLYLHEYDIEVRCVNGKMVSTSKRLR